MKRSWCAGGASAVWGLALLACGGKHSTDPAPPSAGGDSTGSSADGSTEDEAGPSGGSSSGATT